VSDITLATDEIAAVALRLGSGFLRNDIILCLSSAQRAVGLLAMTKDYLSRGIGHY